MGLVHGMLLAGASGVGKSTLLRSALVYYGAGAVALAPGMDESSSYLGLLDNPKYNFGNFDDIFFQPALNQWTATGHKELVNWLTKIYTECKEDVVNGRAIRYPVIGCDTYSAVGRLAYNATLAKFQRTEAPPAQSPDGAAFYSYLRLTMESSFRLFRAIRGLGAHLIMTSHTTEAEVSEIQKNEADVGSKKIMPDLPGGFKNMFPASFDLVFHVGVMIGKEGEKTVRKHYVQWQPDPKRPTKSRFPGLSENARIKADWAEINQRIEKAAAKMAEGS